MELIAMHHKNKTSHYIEGFSEQYKCIVYGESERDFIEIMDTPCFKYYKTNRIPTFTNPFRKQ